MFKLSVLVISVISATLMTVPASAIAPISSNSVTLEEEMIQSSHKP